ncbi:MAG: PAS domain-containing protein [Deltaproteobacteria bacterium]
MRRIGEGDFSLRLAVAREPSEKDLEGRFNAMAARLEEMERVRQDLFACMEKGKKEWETTFDTMPDYVVLLDREQRILRINRAMAGKLGVNPKDVIGKFCCPVIHGTETSPDFCRYKEVISHKKEVHQEIFEPRLGGHLLFSLSPVLDAAGEVTSIIQIGRDINQLKKTAEELQRARSFMQQVTDSISETLLIIDNDYHILLANKVAKKKFFLNGKGEDQARPFCYQLTHGLEKPCPQCMAILCPLQEVKKIGLPVSIVHKHTDKLGAIAHEELSATPFFTEDGRIGGIIEVGRDIGERLRVEEENKKLIRREARYRRDQSISTLAGGVAHDFNNNLTAVLGNAELLKFKLFQDQEAQKYIEQIIAAVNKMTGITRQVLAYAKGGRYLPVEIDITKTVRAALAEAKRKKDCSGITVAFDFQDVIWPVLGDANQLKQAMVNILINGLEAMTENGGTLLVGIANHSFSGNWECAFKDMHPPGEFVDIVIQDNGLGIPQDDLESIFEPFFTTKFMGRGLGLPAALGIIQNHGGCLTLESRENRGTTIHVFLPRLKGGPQKEPAIQEKSGRKILVVDDELQVLEFVSTGLQLNGFEVVTATNGFEAMEKVNEMKEEIGLVILDVIMSGLDGKEVYRQTKAIKPSIRIALSSGYDKQVALAGLALQEGDIFLQKPYDLKALLELADNSVARKV